MVARLLHVSDLHVGAREDRDVESALAALVERTRPEVIVASGDLSHGARPAQLEEAARYLRALGPTVVAVPGNHDIPWSPTRLTSPFARFEHVWGSRETVYASEQLHVVGLSSVRPWAHQAGGLQKRQLAWAAGRLADAAPGALRVVALHHPLLGAPWRTRKRPVARRDRVLRSLLAAGAELILGGHAHQSALSERREFEVVRGDVRAAVVAIAPGLGQPRPSRLGEARGLHLYEASEHSISASTYIWRDGDWGLVAGRTFPRGTGTLVSDS